VGDGENCRQRVVTEWCTAQIGMHDHAGRVDRRTEQSRPDDLDAPASVAHHIFRRDGFVTIQPLAGLRDGVSRAPHEQIVRKAGKRVQNPVDSGQRAPRVHAVRLIRWSRAAHR
jgi:hypothetical protein